MTTHHCRVCSISASCQTSLLFLFRLLTRQGLPMSWASDVLLLLCNVFECCLRQWHLKHECLAGLAVKGKLTCLRIDFLHIGISFWDRTTDTNSENQISVCATSKSPDTGCTGEREAQAQQHGLCLRLLILAVHPQCRF